MKDTEPVQEGGIWTRIGLWTRAAGLSGMLITGLGFSVNAFLNWEIKTLVWLGWFFSSVAISLLGLGILLAKVITDRLENEADDHYSRNVER